MDTDCRHLGWPSVPRAVVLCPATRACLLLRGEQDTAGATNEMPTKETICKRTKQEAANTALLLVVGGGKTPASCKPS